MGVAQREVGYDHGMAKPFQIRLSGLLFLVTTIAMGFGLAHWIGLATIPVTVFLFSLVAERVLCGKVAPEAPVSNNVWYVRIFILVICALSTAVAGSLSIPDGKFTLLSPLPGLMLITIFSGLPIPLVGVVPLVSFVLSQRKLFRKAPDTSVSVSFLYFIFFTTVGSTLFIAASWNEGVMYQGYDFVWGIAIINVVIAAGLWCLLAAAYWRPSFGLRVALATLLHYWLFWFALPAWGELP